MHKLHFSPWMFRNAECRGFLANPFVLLSMDNSKSLIHFHFSPKAGNSNNAHNTSTMILQIRCIENSIVYMYNKCSEYGKSLLYIRKSFGKYRVNGKMGVLNTSTRIFNWLQCDSFYCNIHILYSMYEDVQRIRFFYGMEFFGWKLLGFFFGGGWNQSIFHFSDILFFCIFSLEKKKKNCCLWRIALIYFIFIK